MVEKFFGKSPSKLDIFVSYRINTRIKKYVDAN